MKDSPPCLSTSSSCGGSLRSISRSLGRRLSSSRPSIPARAGAVAAEDAGKVAGFAVQTEVPAIQVRPESVAAFSFPEELLTYEPCAEAVRAVFKNGDSERTVHCHVQLTAEEQRKLEVMRAAAQEEGKEFLPSVASSASRFLARSRGDPKKALREMAATQEWRLNYFRDGPLRDTTVEQDLALGIVYFAGRDRWLRPALVVRPARIPGLWHKDKRMATDKLVRLLVFSMEYMMRYMLLPGRVEGGVVLVDMSGLTSTQVPFGPLKSIVSVMANHYVNRIFRFYMLNLPTALGMSAQLGMRFLTDRQRQKMQLVKDVQELRQEFALHQLEEDFGGSRPNAERFFPFPLPAGPFDAGASGGARPDAVPSVHLALTAQCLRGRPWDPALSREENRRLQYTPAAADILTGPLADAGSPAPAMAAATSPPEAEAGGLPSATPSPTPPGPPQRERERCGDDAATGPGLRGADACEASRGDDGEASRGDGGDTPQPPRLPEHGGKGGDLSSFSTNDDETSSSQSAATQDPSLPGPDAVVLEDGEAFA